MFFDAFAALDEILKLEATPCDICDSGDKAPKTGQMSPLSPLSQAVTLQNEKAVLPQGPTPDRTCATPTAAPSSAESFILATIQAGRKTPGAIASATQMGTTAAYQKLDGMVKAGALTMARDGSYSPSEQGPRP